jgi:hypothetical protein
MKLEFDGAKFVLTIDGERVAEDFAIYFSPVKRAPICEYRDGNGLQVYVNLDGASIKRALDTAGSKPAVAKPKPVEPVAETEPVAKPADPIKPIK